jgi:hypothetical protein
MARSPLFVRQQPGGLFSVEDSSLTTGERFYVHAGTGTDGAGYGRNPDSPVATIDYAVGLCTASKGDVIYVMPGHAESLSAAGAITCDVAGVSIIGLGNGANRPTVTWAATDASWLVTAANVTIKNIFTAVSIDEVVSMFAVSAAHCTFDAVDFGAVGTSAQAIQFLLTTNAADFLTVKNCRHRQLTAAGSAQAWIQLVGCDFSAIVDNVFQIVANASTSSVLVSGSTAVIYCDISRNRIQWIGATIDKVISLATGSTGIISDNRIASGTSVATTTAIVGDGCFMFENRWADTAAASGLLAPAVDTDT